MSFLSDELSLFLLFVQPEKEDDPFVGWVSCNTQQAWFSFHLAVGGDMLNWAGCLLGILLTPLELN